MPKGSLNVSLKGADDIFSTEESRQETTTGAGAADSYQRAVPFQEPPL